MTVSREETTSRRSRRLYTAFVSVRSSADLQAPRCALFVKIGLAPPRGPEPHGARRIGGRAQRRVCLSVLPVAACSRARLRR